MSRTIPRLPERLSPPSISPPNPPAPPAEPTLSPSRPPPLPPPPRTLAPPPSIRAPTSPPSLLLSPPRRSTRRRSASTAASLSIGTWYGCRSRAECREPRSASRVLRRVRPSRRSRDYRLPGVAGRLGKAHHLFLERRRGGQCGLRRARRTSPDDGSRARLVFRILLAVAPFLFVTT